MIDGELAFEVQRVVAAPPPVVWALAADTNRVDRMLGAGRASYSYQPARVGAGRAAGVESTWIERGEWVEGEFFLGERHYLTGPLLLAGLRVDVAEQQGGDGCRLAMRSYMRPRAPLPDGGAMLRASIRSGLERYLDAVERIVGAGGAGGAGGDVGEPAVTRARRVVLAAEASEVLSGKTTPIAAAQWEYCTGRFAEAVLPADLRARLLTHLRARPDHDLVQIRPFELARLWGVAPRAVLAAFLHATRAGLVDLRWELACPVCRVAAANAPTLAAVGPKAHCSECTLDFDLDFARNVEAVFNVSKAIRSIEPRLYCAGSPWFRPHVFARLEVPPHGRREFALSSPDRMLVVRAVAPRPLVAEVAVDHGLHIRIDAEGLTAMPATHPGRVLIENDTDAEVSLHLERLDPRVDAALGLDVLTMPEFLDLFATEAPATGVDLTVGAIAVLFSDLAGATSFYERLGDARAFALVEDHFQHMARVIAAHDGAVVKTMGDAVMATFAAPDHALAAAMDMVDETRRALRGHGLALRVGVHTGPCLIVRANQRLDFFGTTVNMASRLQSAARGNQVVFLADLLGHAGVRQLLEARGATLSHERVALKGISETQALVLMDA